MSITYDQQALALGYLIRGKYHDASGTAQTLRLCGPASRMGTGFVLADPDDAAGVPDSQFWRANETQAPVLTESIGKLDQYIAIPGTLSITIPIDYPAEPDSTVEDTTGDATLREHVVSGRWAFKDVDVWFIDLATGDTEHRFRGTWDRDPDVTPGAGSFQMKAKEWLGPLAVPWKMTTIPQDASVWDSVGEPLSSGGMYKSPSISSSGRGFQLAPDAIGVKVGCVWGFNDAPATAQTPGPVWREVVYYGATTGTGPGSPPVGNNSDVVLWFHVSPQYGCGVGVIRLVGDDGTVYESNATGVGSVLVGHNRDSDLGPLGTFAAVQVTGTVSGNFDPETANNKAYARIHGPSTDPTVVEYHATYGTPYTTLSGGAAATPVVDVAGDIMEIIIEGGDYLSDTTILGTSAISDFISDTPSAVAEWTELLSAVPVEVKDDTEMTYRDVLSNLVGGLPADLVWRYDSTAKQRRLYPWWRVPQAGTTEPDWTIRTFDLASSQPPSVSQQQDPKGEYGNDITVLAPDYIDQPAALPIADAALLESRSRNSQQIQNLTEQVAAKAGTQPISRERAWKLWSPHSKDTGAQTSRFIAAELSQPQVWTTGDMGGTWFQLQLGDTIAYEVHGVTERIGMVRTLQYRLEAQTVQASAVHVSFYDDTDLPGGGD